MLRRMPLLAILCAYFVVPIYGERHEPPSHEEHINPNPDRQLEEFYRNVPKIKPYVPKTQIIHERPGATFSVKDQTLRANSGSLEDSYNTAVARCFLIFKTAKKPVGHLKVLGDSSYNPDPKIGYDPNPNGPKKNIDPGITQFSEDSERLSNDLWKTEKSLNLETCLLRSIEALAKLSRKRSVNCACAIPPAAEPNGADSKQGAP